MSQNIRFIGGKDFICWEENKSKMISGLSNLCQKFDVGMNEIISNYFASIDLGNRQLIHLNKSSKGNSIGPNLGMIWKPIWSPWGLKLMHSRGPRLRVSIHKFNSSRAKFAISKPVQTLISWKSKEMFRVLKIRTASKFKDGSFLLDRTSVGSSSLLSQGSNLNNSQDMIQDPFSDSWL